MTVILRYTLENDDSEIIEKAVDFFEQKSFDCEQSENSVFAEFETGYSSDEPVEEYFLSLVKKEGKELSEILGADFTLTGVIDTSYSAGEYMDFQLDSIDNVISLKASDWYLEEDMESYDDFEDFCDNAFECTEEEYDAVKDCDFVYIIETENGDVLSAEVPLYDVEID